MDLLTQSLWTGLSLGGAYSVLAFGFGLVHRASGIFNMAHGSTAMIAGFVLADLGGRFAFVARIAPLFGAVVGGLLALMIYGIAVRPMLSRGHLIVITATLAVSFICTGVAQNIWGVHGRSFDPLFNKVFSLPGGILTGQQVLTVSIGAALLAIFVPLFRFTSVGRSWRAVADDPEGAVAVGINPVFVTLLAMFIGGALAGISAALLVPQQGVSLVSSTRWTLVAVAGAFVGGLGSTWGPAVGGLFLGLVGGIATGYGPLWFDVVQFGLMLIILSIRPVGLIRGSAR